MGYLKHNNGNKPPRKSAKKTEQTPPPPPESLLSATDTAYYGLSELAEQVSTLTQQIGAYVEQAYRGENCLKIFTGEEGAGNYPVLIALDPCSETTTDALAVAGRIATAFERIADALTGKKADAVGEGESKVKH